MPQPYLVGDERAFADFLVNANAAPPVAGPVGGQQTSSVAATAGLNNTETILVQTNLVAGQTLRAGSRIRFVAEGTSTATAANTTTFAIRMGTAGTTSDTSVVSWATAASGTTGTSIPFHVEIEFVVRTVGTGTNGTGAGSMTLVANAATAIGGAVTNVVASTSSTLNSPTATYLSVTHVTAATTTTNTFQNVTLEVQP